jgi:DNA-directed RNA polymerase subunit beta
MGYSSDADILNLFYELDEITVAEALKRDSVSNLVLTEDIVDADKGVVLARAFEPLTKTIVRSFQKAGLKKVTTIDTTVDDGAIIRCLKKDPTQNEEEALKDIYKRLRPGEPPTTANAKALLKRLFQDPRRYDLGRVGRYKLNQKLAMDTDLDFRVISAEDVVEATKYLTRLKRGDGMLDDIDHLGSRRVRTVGELLANQCRVGLARTERLVKERMTLYDQSVDSISPQKLINPKALSTVIRDFFARSQLSQFMDQINPLAELTHKRRLSALGPGGLNRERAGFEVRDVHPSHYGRICPIETPEGPNIGLINSLSLYSTINEFGFIETPYRKVVKGHVTDEVEYLNADQEEPHMIAQANSELDDKSNLVGRVTCRKRDEVLEVEGKDVNYMDVSPKQLISVAAGIIPFLEHDDANRALMGSNMQRQGVPLLQSEAPFVGTGIESRVAIDSKTVEIADIDGIIAAVDANHIVLTSDGEIPKMKELVTDAKKGIFVYNLRKFMRSNAGTCFNQKPIVAKGQPVKKGDVIADGASTDNGELAIGRNILVAFMPWNGYNFEDAILISEKIVKDDIFTSIHVDEFEVTARDTKLGPEEITRDIPNVGEEALKDLNHDGVIRVGAEVKPGDILVGKITPKSETELAPEEKLLRAIFGEKAADVKDSSLVVPSGVRGIIMDVKVSARVDGEPEELSASDRRRQIKKINEEYRSQSDKLREDLTEALSNILLGEKIPLDVKNGDTDEIIIPANRKITKTLLRRLAAVSKHIEIDPSPVKIKIMEIVSNYQGKFDELDYDRERKITGVESGEDADQGVVKSVKVYIAKKCKMQVGDKMAGRHGNKGVVAKVVPEEDMPHLPDGTPVEICLNPLGVPSRMNVGQVLETHLGWACKKLGIKVATPVFDGISESRVREYLDEAGLPTTGKSVLFDGQSGEPLAQEVVVGYMYMLKLNHLVSSKIHARAVGPYSLITQQPLGGKAQYGGQRFGEMEVWALEAYGAAYTLQELLTVKSDDVAGRTRIYESLVKGDNSLHAGTPQSFNVLMKEIQSLCLDVRLSSDGKFTSSTVLDASC